MIEVLEYSYRYSNVEEGNTLIPQALVLDLLAYLKAQEPRVVAISELTSGEPMLVWLEDIDNEETVAGMIFEYVPGRFGFKLTDIGSMDRIYPRIEDYLTRWRCWTSRPDEKRRAETPWE
ncbi:MAG: hypothetical protein J6W84_01695 [Bacteroidales bacterium]|nr:hypothetical protein [Bacteroidales bacterium]